MEFKIDLKNIVKITTEKDGMLYEYEIKNGIITDVSIVNGENITSKRIDELIKKNNEVKKINKIIELDKNGRLDEIAKDALKYSHIDNVIKDGLEFDEKMYDVWKCQSSIHNIEDKILSILRKHNGEHSKELTDALDDYSNYCEKRDKLEDEIWKKT